MAEVDVKSEIAGTVMAVEVKPGDQVAQGAELMVLVSMKMEIPVTSPRAGSVKSTRVAENETVQEGDVLVVLEC